MVDFKKKLFLGKIDKKVNPVEIYETLDRKSGVGPLRPAQEMILNEWYEKCQDKKDLIIKLHTGEGKTLIGLLILQSAINSNNGPCIYVCPNKYLVKQVCDEAEKFGIPFCIIGEDKQLPDEFLSAEKLLITNAHKLFNGKTVFGIDSRAIKIDTILLDDAHTCIDIIREAFSVTINKSNNEELYNKIITLFADDLNAQGEGSYLDILSGDYNTFMAVPYWSWFDKRNDVLKILSEYSTNDAIQYVWPLMRNVIKDYCCFVSGNKIEITPYNPDIDKFGSFSKANHRILMSATTQNDSFFVKSLSFSVEAVQNPLINSSLKWAGEKMLILPALIDENCDRDLVISSFSKIKHDKFGIVALVPSCKSAEQYKSLGASIADKLTIINEIEKLKKGELFSNIVVIVNRYDGIDLPDESCRILIIDSMPYFDSLSERYEESCRPNSEVINKKIAQKIEQGIGRGVRGEKDYCAVLIIGADLVKFMRGSTTNKYFSAQTRKQIDIGLEISNMAQEDVNSEEASITPVLSLITQMLKRDEGWKEYYNSEMNNLLDTSYESKIYEQLFKESQIEKLFCSGQYEKACELMQNFIDKLPDDDLEKGWYLQQLARYTYQISKKNSITMQQSAFNKNPYLLKPIEGIEYKKISFIHENRLNRIRLFLKRFSYYNDLALTIHEVLENLSFGVDSDKFENALKSIGEFLGFISQRPDKEIRKGPDNLWCCDNNQFLLFECKSEVRETRTEISKEEAGQMNNHCAWFDEQYGNSAIVGRFIIIPTKELSYYGDFTHEVRIIRKGKLKQIRENIRKFVKEFKPYDNFDVSDDTLQSLINLHKLNYSDFIELYSEDYFHKTK